MLESLISLLSLFVINGSDIVNQPWNTTFSPYIHLFGQGWLVIPVTFIGGALMIKYREPTVLSVYMILSGSLLLASSIMTDTFPGIVIIYMLITVLGIAYLLYSSFYGRST